jgi:UDP-4-amino-4,6-dideoxy-N-acetyl-beta-L-altrosamine transaminase
MTEKYLPYGHQCINDEDVNAVVEALRGDWLTTGPTVERFESAFAGYIGASHAVSFSSGTAALHGAMHVAGVLPGDFVLAPSLTFAATANAALFCGGKPLFADISTDSLCLDPASAEAACSAVEGVIRVMAPVSYAGYPVDIEAFRELASRFGAILIEDASHALGANRKGIKVGVEADMTVFSFHPVKHITTAEGGMVVTNSSEFARRLRLFRSHGIVKSPDEFKRPYDGPWDNDMIDIGYNYRLSDVACALGLSQLRRVSGFVERRRELAEAYRKILYDEPEVMPPPDHPGHSYHLFPIWVTPSMRKSVFESLRFEGIGVQVHYVPLHLHTYYREKFSLTVGDFPKTELFSAGEISLPIYPDMEDGDVEFVASKLKSAIAASKRM